MVSHRNTGELEGTGEALPLWRGFFCIGNRPGGGGSTSLGVIMVHAHAEVSPDQFEVGGGLVVHMPTGAEFTPHPRREDSLVVWTGEIGRVLSSGAVYRYEDVLAAVKAVWRERSKSLEGAAVAA